MKNSSQQAGSGLAVHPFSPRMAVLLFCAVLALAAQGSAAQDSSSKGATDSAQISAEQISPSQDAGGQLFRAAVGPKSGEAAPSAIAKRAPQARSKSEFDAYQSAAAESDPAKLEAAAIEFAQRFPASELRPFLFQRAMGLYQQRNDSAKALQMARAVLKYDPANPVALLGAAQLLAEGTHEQDLDRDARLQESSSDAQLSLQLAGELAQPGGVSAEQFESMIVEFRAEAHEVLATIAYKRRNYRTAIDEYNAAAAGEKEHAGAVLWLRLAATHEKLGEYSLGIGATEKALAASEPGSPARDLAERELVRLKVLAEEAAAKPPAIAPNATPGATPGPQTPATPGPTPDSNQPIQKTENSRSPAAGQ